MEKSENERDERSSILHSMMGLDERAGKRERERDYSLIIQ